MKKIVSLIFMLIGIIGGMGGTISSAIFVSKTRFWSAGIAMLIGLGIYVFGCTLSRKYEEVRNGQNNRFFESVWCLIIGLVLTMTGGVGSIRSFLFLKENPFYPIWWVSLVCFFTGAILIYKSLSAREFLISKKRRYKIGKVEKVKLLDGEKEKASNPLWFELPWPLIFGLLIIGLLLPIVGDGFALLIFLRPEDFTASPILMIVVFTVIGLIFSICGLITLVTEVRELFSKERERRMDYKELKSQRAKR